MSDDGERSCPLCAEEMDLTDQQLKPCRCGYEICVWCWHHIVEMAEKDDSEARCPACRTPYDKERIVGTAANCERVVAEVNAEKKQKFPKAKPKTSSEARKHLNSVRVIQRNLVYIIGLPSTMADENLLERREYFGQYGRVLKVSISRTTGGAQQASNASTFSVYITYAKEEEAIRCIQAVHNFVLEGKTLRACFGTTKYCRAWLRNMTCNNPDCLYLHDVGCQEDSFTKDEVISAYTRSRVPPMASGNVHRRIGSVLPPPADDFCNSTTVSASKIVIKVSSNTSVSQAKGSLDIGGSGKAAGLPAAASCSSRTSDSSRIFVGKYSQTISGPSADGSLTNENSAWDDDIGATLLASVENHAGSFESCPVQAPETSFDTKPYVPDSDLSAEFASIRPYDFVTSKAQSSSLIAQEGDREGFLSSDLNMVNSSEFDRLPQAVPGDKAAGSRTDVNGFNIQNLSSHLSILNLDNQSFIGLPSMDARDSVSDAFGEFITSPPCFQQRCTENGTGNLYLRHSGGSTSMSEETHELSDRALEPPREASDAELQHCASHVITQSSHLPYSSGPFFLSDAPSNHTLRREVCDLANEDFRTSDVELNGTPHQSRGDNTLSNGQAERKFGCSEEVGKFVEYPDPVSIGENQKYFGRLHNLPVGKNVSVDTGESNIISNILSMDFDPWNDTSVSTDSFAKFLCETDEQNSGLKMTNLWKGQSNNQSRFSFARQESQTPFSRPSFSEFAHVQTNGPGLHGSLVDIQNGFAASSSRYPVGFSGDQSAVLIEKSAAASRAKTSAPPGFSVPNRLQAPPPGFSSHDKLDQAYDSTYSENHMYGGGPSLRREYPMASAGYSGDVEFLDPAILAVGKGRLPHGVDNSGFDLRYAPPPQFNGSDVDPRLQLLMQQSVSAQQELRIPENFGGRFLPVNDSYVPSRHLHQNLPPLSPFDLMSIQHSRNAQWEGWNDIQANSDPGMGELLRNKRLGLNRYFPGNEEKFRAGDVYNRDFGM
ncbi:unnamed protein product [Spirodela intermedia]|uniref:Uncharacterized protein n=1 Tax=Spirodela intermedia TaxID=51605 RepID=A0A7I8L8T4_SPIIN|nr:unnamed protein product [Spirodela intermedia]